MHEMDEYIMVKNWDRYQHYSKRNPPWIKIYSRMLDDYDMDGLSDVDKWHLIAIFLLASRYQNQIPADTAWIRKKIGASHKINFAKLISHGFIECYPDDSILLAARKPNGAPETETETETEEERYTSHFKAAWIEYPKRPNNPKKAAFKAWTARVREGVKPEALITATKNYSEWCMESATEAQYVKMASTFYGPGGHWEEFANGKPEPIARETDWETQDRLKLKRMAEEVREEKRRGI